jgi:sugar transferase (PEP-CTERM/EpsH1 system associated)
MAGDKRPLVLHVVHRFDTGGLENGLVNLINHMPESAYRHGVLALTEITDFRHRVKRADVGFYALNKAPGHGVRCYPRLWRLLRDLRPAVLHTRNLGPLEMQPVAAAAGVPARLHGEHGRELNDTEGNNQRLQTVRRVYSPFVHHYVALSRDLQTYLVGKVGISAPRITQIYNGVDAQRFHPAVAPEQVAGCPFSGPGQWLVGTVGRMQGVKNQTLLAHAFVRALELQPLMRQTARLVLVGDGPLRAQCQSLMAAAGVAELAWLPGERSDVAEVMRSLNCFVLPSLGEGISNTILEAMASGLPVIATRVGGNAELVDHGRTGIVVASADVEGLAQALVQMHDDTNLAAAMGRAGRAEVERRFSLQAMVAAYQAVYDRQLARAGVARLEI